MSGTILLADDSLTIQKVIELTFAETGFDVIAVSSGEELMQKLPECRPDVVICDVIMPGIDGYEVCQEIKSDPDSLHIPVILLTGTFEPFDKDRALAAGCSEIITKPFEARKLVDAVEKLVQQDAGPSFGQPATDDGRVTPPAFESQVEPPTPQYDGQVVPPPVSPQPETDVADIASYQTQLMEATAPEGLPEDNAEAAESLDFTSTGFSDMEAAGQREEEAFAAPPEDGLEYEFGSAPPEESPMPSADTGPVDPYEAPEPAEFSAPNVADAVDDGYEFGDSQEPNGGPFGSPKSVTEERDTGPVDGTTMQPSADTGPIDPEVTSAYADTAPVEPESEPIMPSEPETTSFKSELIGEPETTAFESESIPEETETPEPIFGEESETADTAPSEDEEVIEEPIVEVEESALDDPTIPPGESVDEPAHTEIPDFEPAAAAQAPGLSDEDVDRIARRMLELAAEKIEMIAWEVIPDMAEIVVRERIRELEAKVENVENDPGEALQ